jgi:hypothetical protein
MKQPTVVFGHVLRLDGFLPTLTHLSPKMNKTGSEEQENYQNVLNT